MTLAQLLAVRRRLSAGEVVTLGVALARELAALHAQGRAHGSVRPDNVLLGPDRRPSLRPAPRGLVAAVDGPSAADDLGALRELLSSTLDDRGSTVGIVLRDLDVTGARELASRLLAAQPPGAIRTVAGSRRRRRWSVPVVLGAVAVVCAGAAPVVAGLALGGGSPHPAPPPPPSPVAVPATPLPAAHVAASPRMAVTGSPAPSRTKATWRDLLAGLDRQRSRAFAQADASLLGLVYVARSPALRRDRALVERLSQRGLRVRGLRWEVERCAAVRRSRDVAGLRVMDRRAAYVLVNAEGEVMARRTARGLRTWRLTLHRVDGRWLVWEVGRR